MAKFYITNNREYYFSLKQQIENSDFQLSFDYSRDNLFALAVHKLRMENQNAVQNDNDFCIATGTCIYKESSDINKLLEDFNNDVPIMRNNAIGQYGIGLRKGDELILWGDACGCYDIYYYYDKDNLDWIVSNSLYEIAFVLHDKIKLNDFSIVERTINRSLVNGETFFNEISRLRGSQYITIDLRNQNLCVHSIHVEFPISENVADAVIATANACRENARIAAKVFGVPTICATGGLDSRILIASFLSADVKPILLYGVGNNKVSSPRKEDEECVDMIGKRFDLKVIKGDFSISNPINKDWDDLIRNFGFTAAYMWGGQKNIIDALHSGTPLTLFGWGGELLRNITGWSDSADEREYSIEELSERWYMARASQSMQYVKNSIPNYEEMVNGHLKELCKALGLDSKKMSIDDTFYVEIAYRCMADTQIPSFMQHSSYAWLPPFEYNVLRNRVHHQYKDGAEFMLRVIDKLYSPIFDVPIFSHEHFMILDRQSMRLTLPSSRVKYSFIKSMIPERIKESIMRPIKRKLVKNTIPQEVPRIPIYSIDKLAGNQCPIDIIRSTNSEDVAIYAILMRTLKHLHYCPINTEPHTHK